MGATACDVHFGRSIVQPQRAQRVSDRAWVDRIEPERGVARDRIEIPPGGTGNRNASVHRLEHGVAPALEERREHQAPSPSPQRLHGQIIHVARKRDEIADAERHRVPPNGRCGVTGRTGAHQWHIKAVMAQQRNCLE